VKSISILWNRSLSSGPGTAEIIVALCGGLTLAGCQVPPKPLYPSPFSAGQGRGNIMKSSWVKIRTWRNLSAITITGKTGSAWGKLI